MSTLSKFSTASTSGACSTSREGVAVACNGPKRKWPTASEKLDLSSWRKANELAAQGACELKLHNVNEDSVMGTLFERKIKGRLIYLFISTNERLPANSLDDLSNAQLLFHDIYKKECIPLSPDKVLHVWHSLPRGAHPGNTVVELNDDVAEEVRTRGADFIRVEDVHPGMEVQ